MSTHQTHPARNHTTTSGWRTVVPDTYALVDCYTLPDCLNIL